MDGTPYLELVVVSVYIYEFIDDLSPVMGGWLLEDSCMQPTCKEAGLDIVSS